MEGIKITSDDTHIFIEFNDLAAVAKMKAAKYQRSAIISVFSIYLSGGAMEYVEVSILQERKRIQICLPTDTFALPIAEINGEIPANIDELYEKIQALTL